MSFARKWRQVFSVRVWTRELLRAAYRHAAFRIRKGRIEMVPKLNRRSW